MGKSSKEIIQNILRIPYNVHSFRSLIRNAYCVISPSKEYASTLKHQMNVNAYYVPNLVSQKMLELVENTNMAKYMGLKGRKWVEENLCPSRYGEALAKVYVLQLCVSKSFSM